MRSICMQASSADGIGPVQRVYSQVYKQVTATVTAGVKKRASDEQLL